jgi:hypothetical protein
MKSILNLLIHNITINGHTFVIGDMYIYEGSLSPWKFIHIDDKEVVCACINDLNRRVTLKKDSDWVESVRPYYEITD